METKQKLDRALVDAEADINNILSMSCSSAARFAKLYLKHNHQFSSKGFPVSEANTQKAAILMFRKIIQKIPPATMTKVKKDFDQLIKEFKKGYRQAINSIKMRMPVALRSEDDVIYEALADFEVMLNDLEKAENMIAKCSTDKNYFQIIEREYKERTKAIEQALTIEHPEPVIQYYKRRQQVLESVYKEMKGQRKRITLDDCQKLMIYNACKPRYGTILTGAPKHEPEIWPLAFLFRITTLIPEKKVGRPTQMFYKALQIAIYTILSESIAPKRAQSKAAKIINTFFNGKRYKQLTPKDIENAVHSSS